MSLLDTTGFHLHDELPPAPTEVRRQKAWLGILDHLSPTSLGMFRRCPRQFFMRYVKGQKERPGEALVIGSIFHETLEWNYTQKIRSHVDRPLSEVVEYLGDAAVPKVIEEAGGKDEIRWDVGGDTTLALDRARDDALRMTGAYHATVLPRIQPVAVEQRIEWQPTGFPLPVIGYLDTITDDHRILDTKTGKQVTRRLKPSWNLQGLVYSNARGMPVEFHSVSRAKTPAICTPLESEEMVIEPNLQQAQNLIRLMRLLLDQIEWYMNRYGTDEEWPATGRLADWSQSMLPCNFCGWKSDCPSWAGETT